MDILWIPELAPLREAPAFAGLVESLGLPAYWATKKCRLAGGNVACGEERPASGRSY